jgi:chromosome segregation ATPase
MGSVHCNRKVVHQMKRFEEELRVIRQQMEEDFVLHSERIFAQKQSIERVERALEQVENNLGVTNERVDDLSEQVQELSDQVSTFSGQVSTFSDQVSTFSDQVSGFSGRMNTLSTRVDRISDALHQTTDSVICLRREFGDFAHTTRAYHDTWASERKRNLRLLVVQTGMLTSGLETEARFERMEEGLRRLEEGKEGAA